MSSTLTAHADRSRRRLRALVDMSLRHSADPASPLYHQWYDWPAGMVFTPPAHMNVARALERGIAEEVD